MGPLPLWIWLLKGARVNGLLNPLMRRTIKDQSYPRPVSTIDATPDSCHHALFVNFRQNFKFSKRVSTTHSQVGIFNWQYLLSNNIDILNRFYRFDKIKYQNIEWISKYAIIMIFVVCNNTRFFWSIRYPFN